MAGIGIAIATVITTTRKIEAQGDVSE